MRISLSKVNQNMLTQAKFCGNQCKSGYLVLTILLRSRLSDDFADRKWILISASKNWLGEKYKRKMVKPNCGRVGVASVNDHW